jgi:tetratricopeptide (TPR) repeat protein
VARRGSASRGVARSINAEPPAVPQPAPESEAAAEDAWADYEEDANAWVLTDEQPVLHPGQSAGRSPTAATGAFDPKEYAVPDGPSPAGAAVGSLEGQSGADAGRSWPLSAELVGRGRIRLGRGPECDVVLHDPSISRAHAELVRGAQGWEIVDLQSGNGTFVAGQRTARAAFVPGEPLGLGHARYRLVLPGAAAPVPRASRVVVQAPLVSAAAAEAGATSLVPSHEGDPVAGAEALQDPQAAKSAPPPLFAWLAQLPGSVRMALFAALGGAGLLGGAGAWHVLRAWDVVGPLHTGMFEHYIEGVQALHGHRWADAEAAFGAFVDADPNNVRGRAYQQATAVGRKDAQQLEVAQRALAAGNLAQAYRASEGLEDGFFHTEARSVRQSITARITVQVDRAHQALEAGHVQQAQDILAEVEATVPKRPDVALLRRRADASLGMLVTEAPPPHAGGGFGRRRVAPLRRRMAPVSGPLAEAVRDFNAGDTDAALAKMQALNSPAARQMAQATRTFVHAYETGLAEHRGKRAFNAIQALTQAKVQEAAIGGGQGKLAGLIDSKLADMYYVMGMQAYARGSWAEAGEAWRQAIERVPSHALSRRKLEELDEKAKALLDEANNIKAQDTEKARSLLRQVAHMAPAGSDLAGRAKRLDATLR